MAEFENISSNELEIWLSQMQIARLENMGQVRKHGPIRMLATLENNTKNW